MNIIRLFVLLIFLAIFFCMHYYIYRRIKIDFSLPGKYNIILAVIIFLIGNLFFLSEILKRTTSFNKLAYFGEIWFGITCITMTMLLLKDVTTLAIKFFYKDAGTVLLQKINYSAYVLSFIMILISLWYGSRTPLIKKITLSSVKIPEKYSGFKIVQLSDMHINNTTSENKLQNIIEKVNALSPDIIVITGDMIDAKFFELQKECDILKQFKAKHGIYTVSGNHEFYTGINYFIEFNKCLDFKLLENESVDINDAIRIAGVHDLSAKQVDTRFTSDINKALGDNDGSKFTLLLSHNPSKFDDAVNKNVDLQLSGHVHKGQFPPAYPAVYLMFKYPYGLYKVKNSYIYTTSGTLTWGPTMRLFSRNEIIEITLTSAKN